MYLIAIAWAYVTILMAASERSFVAGLLTLVFYGIAPLALFVWLFGTPQRRRAARARATAQAHTDTTNPAADRASDNPADSPTPADPRAVDAPVTIPPR